MLKLDFVFFSFSAGGYCSQPGGNQRWRVQILLMPRQVPGAHCMQGILPADQQPEFLVLLYYRVNSVSWEPRRLSGPLPPLSKGSPSTGNCIWTCTWWWSTRDVPGRVSTTTRRVSQLRPPTLYASRACN